MTGKELAQAVGDFVNGCSRKDMEEFASELTERVHRTLQQKAMGLFMACIKKWATRTSFDLRNEATVKLCRRIDEAVGKDSFLPYV